MTEEGIYLIANKATITKAKQIALESAQKAGENWNGKSKRGKRCVMAAFVVASMS